MHLHRTLLTTTCAAFLFTVASAATPAALAKETTSVAPNVPYSAVTELDFDAPLKRLSYGPDALQFIDLWPRPDEASPLVIFIHGGCWLSAYDIKHSYPATSALWHAGFTVASIEYRRTGDTGGGWPGSWNDIQNAIDSLRQQAQFNDPQRKVILMGHSAGGHLALLAANQFSGFVDHVVGLAAITDLASYIKMDGSCQRGGKQFMHNASAADWQVADPARQPPTSAVTLLQGEADSIVPVAQATRYDHSTTTTVITLPKAGHFDWIHPQTDAWKHLLATMETIHESY
ncbi:hypothetical protein PSI9734_01975 [Pseudidiomarina piscicola]|uniref:BD-FAE-like domain-containing protein n=1 Tax=Pseudidiomarina piscicola TaxID=2614830 RepID=A0A6S6WND6_9GAMM|nr:alpha/beta hydrolase [Pseudidiomarina piscicola]CAB0151601.1 hypothetical protein PSI9734_01975 [Pseudidiomarina piscicola]VZT41066.1 hypothetical protein PSI9734_01975 [Pseudomonas aeruginosa]